MTRFPSAAARRTEESKLKKAQGLDPVFVENFAREMLVANRAKTLPRDRAYAAGTLALSILERSFQKAGWEEKTGKDISWEAIKERLVPHSGMTLLREKAVLEALLTLSDVEGNRQSQRLSQKRRLFEIGLDGHPLTRETCANLNLARHFERISDEFSVVLARAFASLCEYGPAYGAWERRLPLLVCDITRGTHQKLIRALADVEPGGLAVLTETLPNAVRQHFLSQLNARVVTVIEDKTHLFARLIGIGSSDVLLLERRLGGWCVTYPLGGVDSRELKNKRYPLWARRMASCAACDSRFPIKETAK